MIFELHDIGTSQQLLDQPETNMGFLSFTAADVGTASQPTASGRDAATNVTGSQRKGSQKD